jgi:hypothetical protein
VVEMIEILSNGNYGREIESLEGLKEVIKEYVLDPRLEMDGNFIYNPEWKSEQIAEKYKGCSMIFGRFLNVAHVFRIITDDKNLIKEFKILIDNNKKNERYQSLRKALIENKVLFNVK